MYNCMTMTKRFIFRLSEALAFEFNEYLENHPLEDKSKIIRELIKGFLRAQPTAYWSMVHPKLKTPPTASQEQE